MLKHLNVHSMGVESGETVGRVPRSRKISGGRPPEMMIFQQLFFDTYSFFSIFHHFQNKVAEIRGETKFWGLVGLGAYESVPPQRKLRGDAPGSFATILDDI